MIAYLFAAMPVGTTRTDTAIVPLVYVALLAVMVPASRCSPRPTSSTALASISTLNGVPLSHVDGTVSHGESDDRVMPVVVGEAVTTTEIVVVCGLPDAARTFTGAASIRKVVDTVDGEKLKVDISIPQFRRLLGLNSLRSPSGDKRPFRPQEPG